MIGQIELLNKIDKLIENDKFPRFSILVGLKGSGRSKIAKEIGCKLNATIVQLADIKVDTIRNMIKDSYNIMTKTIYIMPNCDNMSPNAQNAILKIVEEPPNNSYFIMTVEDDNNLLNTIRGRGTSFRMNTYTPDELMQFADTYLNHVDDTMESFIVNICDTPGEVLNMCGNDSNHIKEFRNYVDLVINNIGEVSTANALKIGNKIAFKDEADKYDLRMFFKTFSYMCILNMTENKNLKYAKLVQITSKCLQQLRIKGINKSNVFDKWVLAIREELR
jgi:DNA polymerase-3 subunit delta'